MVPPPQRDTAPQGKARNDACCAQLPRTPPASPVDPASPSAPGGEAGPLAGGCFSGPLRCTCGCCPRSEQRCQRVSQPREVTGTRSHSFLAASRAAGSSPATSHAGSVDSSNAAAGLTAEKCPASRRPRELQADASPSTRGSPSTWGLPGTVWGHFTSLSLHTRAKHPV